MKKPQNQTKIVGILNITPDSFSDGGKYSSLEFAVQHLLQILKEGADVIDIGAESTRPGATPISVEEELRRLEEILPQIIFEVKKFNQENNKFVQTSIDSYHFETIKKAWELGINIINDVSGLVDEEIINFIAKNNITTILMHNLAIHANPHLIINPHLNLTEEILNWARQKISYLEKKGVKKSQLIFDPGIGFAKNADQSIRILKNIDAYRELDLPLYIGHSKKGFLDKILVSSSSLCQPSSLSAKRSRISGVLTDKLTRSSALGGSKDDVYEGKIDRAQKTLLVSKYLIEKNVEFIRVHDVGEHVALRN